MRKDGSRVWAHESQRIILFNPAAETMFGLRATDVIGQSLDILIPEAHREAHRRHLRAFAESGSDAHLMGRRGASSLVGRRSGGYVFPIEAAISRTRVGEQWMLTAVVRDVSDRVREAAARDFLVRAAGRMNRMIQDLLDISRLETGRLQLEERTVEPGQLLEEAYDMLQPLAEEAGVHLTIAAAPELPRVCADPDRLQQVISNLVGNAVKFTASGGRITVGAQGAPGAVVFSVEDTGIGGYTRSYDQGRWAGIPLLPPMFHTVTDAFTTRRGMASNRDDPS